MYNIFYFFTLIAIMYESMVIISPIKIGKRLKGYKAVTKENITSNQKAFAYLQFLYFAWMFVGLMSSQWIVFLTILLLSFIPKKFIVIRWIDAVITFAMLVFIVINKYHLHIDLFKQIISLF